MKKNNEAYNSAQRNARIKRATKLLRKHERGMTVVELAKEAGLTATRIYKLIASVRP